MTKMNKKTVERKNSSDGYYQFCNAVLVSNFRKKLDTN